MNLKISNLIEAKSIFFVKVIEHNEAGRVEECRTVCKGENQTRGLGMHHQFDPLLGSVI